MSDQNKDNHNEDSNNKDNDNEDNNIKDNDNNNEDNDNENKDANANEDNFRTHTLLQLQSTINHHRSTEDHVNWSSQSTGPPSQLVRHSIG